MTTETQPRKRGETPSPEDIRAARDRASMTQKEAAELIYRTVRNWQQWEGGERQMDPALWELFGLKVAQRSERASK